MASTDQGSSQGSSQETASSSSRRGGLAQKVKQDSRERIERGKEAAAEQVEQLADAMVDAGAKLDTNQPSIATYAVRLAGGLDHLAQRLRRSSIEDLARDTRNAAARNPGTFLLASAALGIVLARFLKASGEAQEDSTQATDSATGDDLTSEETLDEDWQPEQSSIQQDIGEQDAASPFRSDDLATGQQDAPRGSA
jgi:hypothetical protein